MMEKVKSIAALTACIFVGAQGPMDVGNAQRDDRKVEVIVTHLVAIQRLEASSHRAKEATATRTGAMNSTEFIWFLVGLMTTWVAVVVMGRMVFGIHG